jgi:hypothetical protein
MSVKWYFGEGQREEARVLTEVVSVIIIIIIIIIKFT